MNEELKIIITAAVQDAVNETQKVNKELQNIKKNSTQSGKSFSDSMKTAAKGAAVAVAAITAVTTAMVSLGNKAQDVQKGFSKLQSSFENAGSSAKQATKYYKELFGIIGDHDRTIETAQSIARITTDTGAQGDYKNIMAGAISKYGDGYNTEALSENISETIAAAKVTGDLARVLVEAGISEDGFNAALAQTTDLEQREIMIRKTLNGVLGGAGEAYIAANQGTILYNESQARLNITLAEAAAYTQPFLTSINDLGSTLLTVLGPALETVALYLTAFIQLIASAIQWVGNFFGLFSSGAEESTADIEGYQQAYENYLEQLRSRFGSTNKETDKTINKLKELKKQTMGFDELNVVSSPTSIDTGAGAGGGGGVSMAPLPVPPNPKDYGLGGGGLDLSQYKKDLDEAKEKIKAISILVGLVAGTIGLWKLYNFITDLTDCIKYLPVINKMLKEENFDGFDDVKKALEDTKNDMEAFLTKVKGFAGVFLMIAGAILLVTGYSDAWVNGLDWGNFALILSGIGLIVGGIALKFGGIAAPIALIVGGIAALVIGIKDLVTNGYSMEAVLMVLAGALAVGIGLVWALNAALLANPITWIVVGIAALVAAFVILWNECEGFRNFWINLWEGVKAVFWAVIDWIVNAFNSVINFFKENWQLILEFLTNPFGAAFKLLYNNCDGFRAFIDEWVEKISAFFKELWNNIVNIFKGIGKWFSDVFNSAWQGIKKAFSNVVSFFKNIWNSITSIFTNVGTAIANAISGAVKTAINWILEKAIGIINGFLKAINFAIDVINAIPGVSISKLSLLSVPKLATGGIVTRDTLAHIGEGGKREAVLPLDQNTGWMDILADRISQRNSAPSKIVLMVDGKELGWASINGINDITNQTGNLQLQLV